MGKLYGEPFRGVLHSVDASTAEPLILFKDGSTTAFTLEANEYLEVHSVQIVSAAGGDVRLFTGPDNTPGTGEDLNRGTFTTNGGIVQELEPTHSGNVGESLFLQAPIGVVDVIVRGGVRRGDGTTNPSWQARD